jgi:hypothetical protein
MATRSCKCFDSAGQLSRLELHTFNGEGDAQRQDYLRTYPAIHSLGRCNQLVHCAMLLDPLAVAACGVLGYFAQQLHSLGLIAWFAGVVGWNHHFHFYCHPGQNEFASVSCLQFA